MVITFPHSERQWQAGLVTGIRQKLGPEPIGQELICHALVHEKLGVASRAEAMAAVCASMSSS